MKVVINKGPVDLTNVGPGEIATSYTLIAELSELELKNLGGVMGGLNTMSEISAAAATIEKGVMPDLNIFDAVGDFKDFAREIMLQTYRDKLISPEWQEKIAEQEAEFNAKSASPETYSLASLADDQNGTYIPDTDLVTAGNGQPVTGEGDATGEGSTSEAAAA